MTVGLVAGAGIARAARAALFDVRPSDPAVTAIVAAVLGTAAFVACTIPAIGATRVDPTVALRNE